MFRDFFRWLFGLPLLASALLFGATSQAQTDSPAPKILEEIWESAYFGMAKAGSMHTRIESLHQGDQSVLRATKELRLQIRRGDQRVRLRVLTGSEESPSGQVQAVFMQQGLGQQQTMALRGEVDGNRMRIQVEGPVSNQKTIAWKPEFIGLAGETHFLAENKPAPGSTLSYTYFEPTVSFPVTITLKVGQVEPVSLPGRPAQKLLRVEATPEKIQQVQLPTSTIWCDPDSYQIIGSRADIPGLGEMTLVRSTKQLALAPGSAAAPPPDIFAQSIPLGHSVPNIHRQAQIRLKVEPTQADENAVSLFASDARQYVQKQDDGSLMITIKALREPVAQANPEEIGKEFRVSNYFINSDDPQVRALAKQAIGDASTPWDKARRIERWVNRNMRSFAVTEAMATADHVARTLRGDCSEFAMLTAAMCRAADVPSRTAVGLIYVDQRPRPTMAYHMWTEVWIDGQWLALDATLGQGSVGPGHLKIAAHSWYETRSMLPMLPVLRVVMTKPRMDIVSYTPSP